MPTPAKLSVATLALVLGGFSAACTEQRPSSEGAGAAGVESSGGTAGAGMGGSSEGGAAGFSGAGASSGGASGGSVSQGGSNGSGGSGAGGSGARGGESGSTGVGGAGEGGSGGAAGSGGSGATAGAGGSGAMAGAGGGSAGGPGGLTSFRMVVLGSSSAAGEGASSSSRGWVSLLSNALDEVVLTDWSSRNLAQGGYTTRELLPDSGANGNIDDALELEPDLVIVALAGSNDLSSGTSESVFLSRLTAVRDAAQAAGVPVFFLSTAPKDLSTSERQELRDWADAMATRFTSCWAPGRDDEYSPCFIDIFAPLASSSLGIDPSYNAGDGIHLNDAGHQVIFEAARDVVTAYVCSMTMCR